MEMTKLILDFIKSSLWPIVAVIALINYGEQLMGIVSTREVDVFGVKIGQSVSALSTNHSQEIADWSVLIITSKKNYLHCNRNQKIQHQRLSKPRNRLMIALWQKMRKPVAFKPC